MGCRFSHARLSYIGSRELSEKKFGSRDNKILFSISKKNKENRKGKDLNEHIFKDQ